MKININIPQSWNDLNDRQLKRIATLFHKEINPTLFDALLFFILLDIRLWQFLKSIKATLIIKNVGMSELKKTFNFIYNKIDLTKFIKTIKSDNQIYYAPMNRMINLTIDEFAHTEDLFIHYQNTKDTEALRYLAAVLYREQDYNNKRVPFDKTELDLRSQKLSRINKKTLYAIALSYQGCRNYLYPKFPRVFPQKLTTNNTTPVSAPKTSNLGKLILAMSGQKFGTYTETKNTNLYIFLSEFEEQLKKPKPSPRKATPRHA